MIKVAVGLGAGLLVAYAALPEARAFIQAIAPFLLVLICPAAMLFMMKGMRDNSKDMGSKPRENEVASGDRWGRQELCSGTQMEKLLDGHHSRDPGAGDIRASDFQQGIEKPFQVRCLHEDFELRVRAEQVAGKEVLVFAKALDLGQRQTTNANAPEPSLQRIDRLGRNDGNDVAEFHDDLAALCAA
jgi:hypothetical protein